MRKRKKSEEGGFNVWRSYSDMMAGVLLLFIRFIFLQILREKKGFKNVFKR